jgi:FtsP/CotA-like multicopper oxidase with cupredoxin domain
MYKNIFGLAFGLMLGLVGASTAWAQEIPPSLQPPADQQRYLQVHAQGDQIYVCKSESSQFAWALKAPEAQLTDVKGQAFGRHFAGPTWQANDGSRVTGTVAMKLESPDAHSIPWLLLNVASHEGAGVLSRAKTIQRVNTKGGKAPGSGCDPDHVNQEVRAHYTADYNFYAAK